MMDVKDTNSGSATSITSMLARSVIAKNQEQKEVLARPVREEEPKKVSKADEPSKQSPNAIPEIDNSQPSPTTGNLVNVNV